MCVVLRLFVPCLCYLSPGSKEWDGVVSCSREDTVPYPILQHAVISRPAVKHEQESLRVEPSPGFRVPSPSAGGAV